MPDTILITSALPYANGPLHVGHMVEFVQTDVLARFLRSCGHDVIYLCADDTHGTPIELNAAKQGMKPEEFVAKYSVSHQADLKAFDISLNEFGSTHSPENRHYAELIYQRLKTAGDIDRRDIEQTYCEKDKRFLPDRFVRGLCPNCRSPDQYGDACEKCGKTYNPTELIDPRCQICGTPPVRKRSTHLFFTLSKHASFLLDLIRKPDFIHQGVANQLQQFFEKGLADWDISRDGPYFGFEIPGETDKYFYVWLDAPIGYVSTTERWAKSSGKAKSALDHWSKESKTRIIHVIGKDIVYFHALFWPAMLEVSGLKRPERLVIHGHLTVNGEKMSKSRGTLVAASTYLQHLDPSYLRYFFAANLGPGPEDFDLSLNDFRLRVNGELVNNFGNLANRVLTMLAGPLERRLAEPSSEGPGRALVEEALVKAKEVRAAYERLEFRQAVKLAAEISQSANQFLQTAAPWVKIKKDVEGARRDLTDAAEVVYLVAGLLSPIVPRLTDKLLGQLQQAPLTFEKLQSAQYPLLQRAIAIGTPEPLIARMEEVQVNELIPKESITQAPVPPAAVTAAAAAAAPVAKDVPAEIDFDQFAKVDLRVGRILSAERVPKADKLLKLSVDLGEASPRTIASGIAEAFAPEQLVGRNIVVVANLKPRTIRGIESKGMILAAGPGGKSLSLIDPGDLKPGSEVK